MQTFKFLCVCVFALESQAIGWFDLSRACAQLWKGNLKSKSTITRIYPQCPDSGFLLIGDNAVKLIPGLVSLQHSTCLLLVQAYFLHTMSGY